MPLCQEDVLELLNLAGCSGLKIDLRIIGDAASENVRIPCVYREVSVH